MGRGSFIWKDCSVKTLAPKSLTIAILVNLQCESKEKKREYLQEYTIKVESCRFTRKVFLISLKGTK